MKKIGIITFHRAINYGAVLQAYALYEIIKQLGGNVAIIDYNNLYIEKAYKFKIDSSIKSIAIAILSFNKINRKHKLFKYFRENYLLLDKIDDLTLLDTLYDNFVTGSDQVWNYMHSDFDKAYFLDFETDYRKKNSYAASFGFDRIPDAYLTEYKELLSDFNHISVREEKGVEIINDLLNRRVEVVLDPTMLLSKYDWVKISKDYKRKKDYILIYHLSASQSLLDFAMNLSKETNCEIIYISDAVRKRFKVTYASGIGPQEFLGLFKNAKYVVTNSFHGTAFSINFNKPFFVEMLPPPANVNSRLENILDTFELRSRQIINGNNDNVFNEIDYASVNKKLELERQRSLDYLKRILEN